MVTGSTPVGCTTPFRQGFAEGLIKPGQCGHKESQVSMKTQPEPDAETTADAQESPLCLGCLAPNHSTAHFCAKCGAPMTSYAAILPFERLFAEGHVYRQAAEKPKNLFVVLGVWLIFGFAGLIGLAGVILGYGSEVSSVLWGAFLFLISLAMIWRTTRSYLAQPRPQLNQEA